MAKPAHVLEVFLQPGETYFGDKETRIRTILGSCVSMTFWHPQKLLGGMSHIMLPKRGDSHKTIQPNKLDGKYADEAFALLRLEMKKAHTRPEEYQVKLFGGGDMFSQRCSKNICHIGSRNIESVYMLMTQHGFKCHAKNLGGLGHRYIIFDVWNGNVWVRHQTPLLAAAKHKIDR